MAETTYTYPRVAPDPEWPENEVSIDDLMGDIAAAGLPTPLGILYTGLEIQITFDPALSAGDETTLDGVVAAYTPPNTSPLKLFRYALASGDHRSINYATGLTTKLHKYVDVDDDTSWFRGETRRLEYHATPEHNDKVLQLVTEWVRNADGTVTVINPAAQWGDADFRGSRTTWTWYREDGTPHPTTKVAVFTYTGRQAMQAGRDRRQDLIDELEARVLFLLLATGAGTEADGMAYMAKYSSELSNYHRNGDLSFKTPPATPNITDDTEPWLGADVSAHGYPPGTTIKDVILESLKTIYEP
jgi:hypothetical protein